MVAQIKKLIKHDRRNILTLRPFWREVAEKVACWGGEMQAEARCNSSCEEQHSCVPEAWSRILMLLGGARCPPLSFASPPHLVLLRPKRSTLWPHVPPPLLCFPTYSFTQLFLDSAPICLYWSTRLSGIRWVCIYKSTSRLFSICALVRFMCHNLHHPHPQPTLWIYKVIFVPLHLHINVSHCP